MVSLAGVAASVAALGYLHATSIGLSPVRDAVSRYGISPRRAGYRVLTISMAVSGASIAVALARTLHGAGVGNVVVLLSVFVLSRLGISWFPMDVPGAERTSRGWAHVALAVAAFLSIALGAIRLCRVLERTLAWEHLAAVSRALGWAMVACLVLMTLSRVGPDLRRAFGLMERALYVAILAWLAVVGVGFATAQL